MQYTNYEKAVKAARKRTMTGYRTDHGMWRLIYNFLDDMLPLIFDEQLRFRPIRIYQVRRIWKIATLAIKTVRQIIKHI